MLNFSLQTSALMLVPVVGLALAGCTARSLDEISSSYERLALQATEAQSARLQAPPARQPLQSVVPPTGSLGSAFLVIGRDALEASSGRGSDPRTKIAFYRVAASSAHFALVEEASTDRPVMVESNAVVKSSASAEPTHSSAAIMVEAVREAKPLCDGLQASRPPRDCTYLEIALSLANLAVVSQPWLFLPQFSESNSAQHVQAFSHSKDNAFERAWSAYQRDSNIALQKLGSPGGQPAQALGRVSSPAEYIHNNDQRAVCMVLMRRSKLRNLKTTIDGVVYQWNSDLGKVAENWYKTRYNSPAPQCAE